MEVRDPEKAFDNAMKKRTGRRLEDADSYMYMYSDKKYDYFKHVDTREYIRFRNRKDPLMRMSDLTGYGSYDK